MNSKSFKDSSKLIPHEKSPGNNTVSVSFIFDIQLRFNFSSYSYQTFPNIFIGLFVPYDKCKSAIA